jgi:Dihaem cytochrome c
MVHDHILKALSLLACLLSISLLFVSCQKSRPLPEQGTYAQQLYVERCGTCHRAYSPASMTAAMWEAQVEAMGAKIVQAGQPPLSPQQHLTILDYLKRNAGKQ